MKNLLVCVFLVGSSLANAEDWIWEGSSHLGKLGKGREFGLYIGENGKFQYKRLVNSYKTRFWIPEYRTLKPVRIVDGTLVDLSFKFRAIELQTFYGNQILRRVKVMDEWNLETVKVIQVLPDEGFLIRLGEKYNSPGPFFLYAPNTVGLAEDDIWTVMIRRNGTYRYGSALGSGKTVRRYDYGKVPVDSDDVAWAAAELRKKYAKEANSTNAPKNKSDDATSK